jgi:hypothetical protein
MIGKACYKSLFILVLVLAMMAVPTWSALAEPPIMEEGLERASAADQEPCEHCQSQEHESQHAHPIMRPSPEDLQAWLERRDNLPQAYIDPNISSQIENWPETRGTTYSLLDHLQYTPAERDQGKCGNCWAWAGTGVMEIALDVQNEIKDRLSIQYLNSNYNGGSGPGWACCGGSLPNVADFYAGTGQAIPWSNDNASWQDGSKYCNDWPTSVPASTISTTPNYPISSITAELIDVYNVGENIAIGRIKNVLNQNKAVVFGFFLPTDDDWDDFYDFWDQDPVDAIWDPSSVCGKTYDLAGGHDTLCVGYNDEEGEDNDYWIILNSWGTTAGRPEGLFHLYMHMNYDCQLRFYGGSDYNFDWRTLDIIYVTEQPTVSTSPATAFGATDGQPTANLNGVIIDDKGGDCEYRFQYGTSPSAYSDETSWTGTITTGASFSETISGLEQETTYYFRAQAKNIAGIGSGGELSFTMPKLFSVTLGTSPDAVPLTVDGTPYSPAYLPKSFSWANGSVHDCVAPSPAASIEEGTQYVFTSWSPDGDTSPSKTITVSGNATYTANYKTQHYLTVEADYGDPSGQGWYDVGNTTQISADELISGYGTRYAFVNWIVDGDAQSGNPVSITMDAPHTAFAEYQTQHYLAVESAYGDEPSEEDWYDEGTKATTGTAEQTIIDESDDHTRHVFLNWIVDDTDKTGNPVSITMDAPHTAVANYKTQHYLTVISECGDPGGEEWYDEGSTATFSVTSPVGGIVRKVFTNWSGDSTSTSPSATILIDEPKTVTANWRDDYLYLYIIIGGIVVVVLVGLALVISTTRGKKPRRNSGTF